MSESIGFMIACRRFFGMREGQKLLEFAAEVKKLTPEDKAELTPLLEKELGVTITE